MVRRINLDFVFFVIIVGVIPMQCFGEQLSLRERFNQDIRHVFALEKSGKPEEAIKHWESVQSEYGNRNGIYEDELGKLLARNGKFTQAETVLITGVELDGNYPPLYKTLVFLYVEMGQVNKAIETGVIATRKFPEWSGSYRVLAYAYNARKMFSKAIEMAERAVGIKPEPLSYHILASSHYHLNEFKEAVAAYNVAIAMEPEYIKNTVATMSFIQSLSEIGMNKEALLIIEAYREHTGDRANRDFARLENEIKNKLSEEN